MKGHIYIKGQIGDSKDAEGNIIEGVKLEDVVMQVEAQKDAESFDVHIDSPGGLVDTGRAIAAYLAKMETPFTTIAENLCGSIATEIHLSAPVENRKILADTKYFIHNPFLDGVSGDAAALEAAADYVKAYQKEMLSMYVKKTGADKSAIEGLMEQETGLTGEQAETLGFVSEVLPKELKAVAFMKSAVPVKTPAKNPNNILNIDMSKITNKIAAVVRAVMKEEGQVQIPVKAAMVTTDKGELSYASEGAMPTVGEAVTIDGEPAAEGDYTMDDGTVIKVDAEGNVAEIVVVDPGEDVEALKARIKELEAQNKDVDKAIEDGVKAAIEDLKKNIGSDYIPKAEIPGFVKERKLKKAAEDIKEEAAARKEEYKQK